ncbi:unnamed protein product [Closterium sp. NIES-54]
MSMTHARAPHFLWPYTVRYAAHQLNLQPRVSRPEASLTSLWTESPGVGLAFRFLVSRDVRFDDSVSYYACYPCRGLPIPPPPLFLAPSPPHAPAPSVPPPPPGPALSCVSNATPLPLVARQVASPSPQSSSQSPQQPSALPRQVTVDSGGVGAGGAATGGTRSGGALLRGAGAGGAGTGGASSGDAGAGGVGAGGASSGGARAGGAGAGGASCGGAGVGGLGTGGLQAARRREREEQEQLEQERQELWQLDLQEQQDQSLQPPLLQQLFPLVSGLWPLGLPSAPPAHSQSPTAYGLTPRRAPPVSVLPPPPASALIVSSHPINDYYRAVRPVLSLVLASLVTDPRASPSSVLALTTAVADFASTRHLKFATRVVAAPPARPLSAGGEFALGCDVLEDKQFEMDFLAVASPSLCAMLLFPEGDPDALDIPTLARTVRQCHGSWLPSGKLPWTQRWRLGDPQAPMLTQFPLPERT